MEHKKTSFSKDGLSLSFAVVAFALMVILKIIVNFGIGTQIFYGVATILILGLSIAGGILSYNKNKDFKSMDFIANAIALVLALIIL